MSMLVDGVPYLNYNTLKDSLNSRFYWDSTNQLMLYTTPTDVIKIPAGGAEYTVSDEAESFDQIIVRLEGETPYIEADFVKQYTNMTYETLQEPDRILVTYKWGTIQQAKVKRDENVRYQGGVKSPILTSVAKGDLVTVLEQLENWTKIATADGYIGYVRNKRLGSVTETTISNEFTEPEYTRIKKDYTINLVWHQISNMDSNYALSSDIESMTEPGHAVADGLDGNDRRNADDDAQHREQTAHFVASDAGQRHADILKKLHVRRSPFVRPRSDRRAASAPAGIPRPARGCA